MITPLMQLLSRDTSLCGRSTKGGAPCKRHRLSSVTVEVNGDYVQFVAPACPSHATAAERAEHAHAQALAEERHREAQRNMPVACWSWPVTGEDRRRAIEASACPDDGEADSLACRLLRDWQAGRCAICGGRAEFSDHDHSTGNVRGWLCHSCNTLEAFAYLPGNCFKRYREKNPASILGLTIRYYSPFTGWAEPAPPPLPLAESAAYALGDIFESFRRD